MLIVIFIIIIIIIVVVIVIVVVAVVAVVIIIMIILSCSWLRTTPDLHNVKCPVTLFVNVNQSSQKHFLFQSFDNGMNRHQTVFCRMIHN